MQSNNPLDPQSYDGIFDSRTHEGGHKGNCQDYWQDSQNVLRDIRWHGEHVMPANLSILILCFSEMPIYNSSLKITISV